MIKKFFGQGDVFINAVSETELRGVTYKVGDLISYFSGVQLELNYNLQHKELTAKGRQQSSIERYPYSLNVSGIKNTKELEKLFFIGGNRPMKKYSTVQKYKNATNELYLKERESPLKVKVFSNGAEIEISAYDSEEGKITFVDDTVYKEIDVISTFEEEGELREFNKPDLGYVQIEASIKGNFGDDKGVFVLSVPLADLVSEPVMDLTESSNYGVTLSFAIINARGKDPVAVFIDG